MKPPPPPIPQKQVRGSDKFIGLCMTTKVWFPKVVGSTGGLFLKTDSGPVEVPLVPKNCK